MSKVVLTGCSKSNIIINYYLNKRKKNQILRKEMVKQGFKDIIFFILFYSPSHLKTFQLPSKYVHHLIGQLQETFYGQALLL